MILAVTFALTLAGPPAGAQAPAAPKPVAPVEVSLLPATAVQAAPTAAPSPVVEAIRDRIDAIRASGGEVEAAGDALRATRSLPQLYQMNGFLPLWDSRRLRLLTELLQDIEDDGLRASDYHLAALQSLIARGGTLSPLERATLDLLASDAYTLILYHLYFGKVDPVSLDSRWNFELREIREADAVKFVHEAITRDRVRASVEQVRPDHWMYAAGRAALAAYRGIAALGGWPQLPVGATLKPGMVDARVPLLRERLALTGDLAAAALPPDAGAPQPNSPRAPATATTAVGTPDPLLFDTTLEAAVRHFQHRHLLATDGAIGPSTLRELNVPVQARIDQIRLNLERGRWVLHEVKKDGDLVIVDIAGFGVRFIRERKTIWQTRAQVGKPYRQTPIFKSAIDHVVLNPTWTVPPTILEKDILPAVRRDRGYLAKRGLEVIDRDGRTIPTSSIDFSRYTGRNFPYMIRQAAGDDNALGQVKIMFPNPYLVYLHDTPSKSLFDADQRAFSSGCIRTERPFELVELLLADPDRWNRAAIDAAVTTRITRTVRLAKPVPVLILYWTVDRDDDGSIMFKPDPYARDARELAALDSPFQVGKRVGI
jgi:murein L,D-transpeptidase YcbB/YkuD